jgi:hypothetical protein
MTVKRRGNPNWGKYSPFVPGGLSTFDSLVKALKLSPEQLEDSPALKDWARRNMNQKYVPAELLQAWGFTSSSEV